MWIESMGLAELGKGAEYIWSGATDMGGEMPNNFFLASVYAYDSPSRTQRSFIGTLFIVNALMLVVFAGVLEWI